MDAVDGTLIYHYACIICINKKLQAVTVDNVIKFTLEIGTHKEIYVIQILPTRVYNRTVKN